MRQNQTMTPERERIEWAPHVAAEGLQTELINQANHKKLRLDHVQTALYRALKQAGTVEAVVLNELKQSRLISFAALHDLMHTLTDNGFINNKSWKELWAHRSASDTAKELNHSGAQVHTSQLEELPFFHGIDTEILKIFAELAQSYRCAPNTRLCTQGQQTRDLFVLLTGEAGVYAQIGSQPKRLIAKLKAPALFGEGGFLLGKPRSADVVTTDTCHVIRIRHSEQIDKHVQSAKAQDLQRRFWILHALSASPLFQNVPLEAWDDLAMKGTLKPLKARQTLFEQGSQGSSFYVLVQGQLSVWQNGKQINHLGQGSCVGEIALLASRGTRTATVMAESDALIQEIPAQQFYPLLARHLPLAKELEILALDRMGRDQDRKST